MIHTKEEFGEDSTSCSNSVALVGAASPCGGCQGRQARLLWPQEGAEPWLCREGQGTRAGRRASSPASHVCSGPQLRLRAACAAVHGRRVGDERPGPTPPGAAAAPHPGSLAPALPVHASWHAWRASSAPPAALALEEGTGVASRHAWACKAAGLCSRGALHALAAVPNRAPCCMIPGSLRASLLPGAAAGGGGGSMHVGHRRLRRTRTRQTRRDTSIECSTCLLLHVLRLVKLFPASGLGRYGWCFGRSFSCWCCCSFLGYIWIFLPLPRNSWLLLLRPPPLFLMLLCHGKE